jgi:hypothetical protein
VLYGRLCFILIMTLVETASPRPDQAPIPVVLDARAVTEFRGFEQALQTAGLPEVVIEGPVEPGEQLRPVFDSGMPKEYQQQPFSVSYDRDPEGTAWVSLEPTAAETMYPPAGLGDGEADTTAATNRDEGYHAFRARIADQPDGTTVLEAFGETRTGELRPIFTKDPSNGARFLRYMAFYGNKAIQKRHSQPSNN